MGKTGKWIRNFLTGKKDKGKGSKNGSNPQISAYNGKEDHCPATPASIPPPTTPKEKRRWSFRRSSTAAPGRTDSTSGDNMPTGPTRCPVFVEDEDSKSHALAVAAATAAAADAAVAAAKAAAAVIQLTSASVRTRDVEEAAATKIQSAFRAYLARRALNALKGIVKLQALVRGHLVRKQATTTLKCMQALIKVQTRALAQRLRMAEETKFIAQRQFVPRKSTQENKFRDSDKGIEQNIKIVEMDLGGYKPVTKARNIYSNHTQTEHRISTQIKQEHHQVPPSPSAITDMSPRTYSNHFDNYSFASPQCYSATCKPDPARMPFSYPRSEYAESESLYKECPFYPSYMANTKSSRAKVRSHSAPKQRPTETFERQTSRRRASLESRNFPKAVRMQRSSSHVGSTTPNYQYPWSVKLDRSMVSVKDSECGSTNTALTNTNYCRSLVGFNVSRYLSSHLLIKWIITSTPCDSRITITPLAFTLVDDKGYYYNFSNHGDVEVIIPYENHSQNIHIVIGLDFFPYCDYRCKELGTNSLVVEGQRKLQLEMI